MKTNSSKSHIFFWFKSEDLYFGLSAALLGPELIREYSGPGLLTGLADI